MLFSHIVQTILKNRGIPFNLIDISTPENLDNQDVPEHLLVDVSFLKDDHGIMMAIYPYTDQLDVSLLKALTHRPELRFLSTKELDLALQCLQNDGNSSYCDKSDIQIIIDEPVSNLDEVYFVTEQPAQLLQTDIWDIQVIVENALIGGVFSYKNKQRQKKISTNMNTSNLIDKLSTIEKLPVMPTIASDLLLLQNNPDSTVDDMVRIISHDPVLTAQVLRYANSSLFGFSGQISNLHDAIFRVLGYETVLYMAFGAALGRSFKLPNSGRLSMDTFWQQATHRAALCQQLAQHMPRHFRPPPSMAYLTGLLHNFGLILIGSIFPDEYAWLNKLLTSRPDQSLTETEKSLFNCTHTDIGRFVLEKWYLPMEVTIVTGEHHNESYSGPHATYVWLVQLAGQALKQHGLSDSDEDEISPELCRQLELDITTVNEELDKIVSESDALQAMAKTLCA